MDSNLNITLKNDELDKIVTIINEDEEYELNLSQLYYILREKLFIEHENWLNCVLCVYSKYICHFRRRL